MLWFRFCAFSAVLSLLAACAEPQSTSKEDEPDKSQAFFTQSNPGRFKEYRDDHNPQVKAQVQGEVVTISAAMPFIADAGHYIEFIALADSAMKQKDIRYFRRGQLPRATFFAPVDGAASLTVVAKCNLHNMWTKPVTLEER